MIVLARDGLRAYDIRGIGADAPCASWLFPPGALGASAPAAFAFGAARGWELFAVFVVAASGDLFYVTPVLPPGVLLPAADWQELRGDLEAAAEAPGHVQVCGREGTPRPCAAPRAPRPARSPPAGRLCRGCAREPALARLELRGGACAAVLAPLRPARGRPHPRPLLERPRRAGTAGALVGGPTREDGENASLVRKHCMRELPIVGAPLSQGPVAFTPALTIPAEQPGLAPPPAVDVAVFPPAALEYTAVALAYGDGRVLSVCSGGPLLPVWGRPPQRRGALASSDGLSVVLPRAAPGEQAPVRAPASGHSKICQ